jgi:hypothetical protein
MLNVSHKSVGIYIFQFLSMDDDGLLSENSVDNERGAGGGGEGGKLTKLLKVYSREAKLMDALIDTCVRRKLHQRSRNPGSDYVDTSLFDQSSRKAPNKLERLVLTAYTLDGEMVEGQ